eukprot:365630-Chlamydomonas_euryale.AAC.18
MHSVTGAVKSQFVERPQTLFNSIRRNNPRSCRSLQPTFLAHGSTSVCRYQRRVRRMRALLTRPRPCAPPAAHAYTARAHLQQCCGDDRLEVEGLRGLGHVEHVFQRLGQVGIWLRLGHQHALLVVHKLVSLVDNLKLAGGRGCGGRGKRAVQHAE